MRGKSAGHVAGFSAVEMLVAAAVVALALAILIPWVLRARAAARAAGCRDHLRTLTLALRGYHDAQGQFPPAAVWSTEATMSLALHQSKRVDLVTRENWAQLLLPFAGEERLAQKFDSTRPIGDDVNLIARLTRLALMICADDTFNRDDNPHRFVIEEIAEPGIEFARGNYAINGGTHDLQFEAPMTAFPKGDFAHLVMQAERRVFQLWGNGVAGINRSFSLADFANGQSTLVAVEEVRAGIHPIDPRGVWALGQIGGSITWGHGVNGDAYAPNHQWPRADDILGCRALHETVGTETVMAERMPCVDYINVNQQATARSLHSGGVHAAFLDGSVRFIADAIDPGVWHVIHSRETPAGVLAGDFGEILGLSNVTNDAQPTEPPSGSQVEPVADVPTRDSVLTNSLGMKFVLIPAGKFTMGLADVGNGPDTPEGCPPHLVNLTRSYFLGSHEVTCEDFARIMDKSETVAGPPAAEVTGQSADDANERMPVAGVTWNEADEFCRRLSLLPEERDAGRWYRLPTEAEWEDACRGGKSEPYRWQIQRRPDDQSGEAAGILPPLPVKPVGSYLPNRFGLFDMRGNVWEWTADWFDRDYYSRSPVDDPRGPAQGYIKVVRGGDWRFVGEPCKIEYAMLPPWKGNPMVGFRVVCEQLTGTSTGRTP
jgi:prepilin-type processing-associated H-X9-DG protein